MGNEDDGPRPPGVHIPVRMTTASTTNQVAQGQNALWQHRAAGIIFL